MLERFVKSRAFDVILCVVWCLLTWGHVRSLRRDFQPIELFWVVYNGAIALLFLIRTRPLVVSLNPLHWIVALLTSFSGLFFARSGPAVSKWAGLGNGLIYVGLALGALALISLGRSYDFIPALRRTKVRLVYGIVRHPMYVSSMIVRLGYVFIHPSGYNAFVFVAMSALYDLRARFEENVMSQDPAYREYLSRVRHRFVPFLY